MNTQTQWQWIGGCASCGAPLTNPITHEINCIHNSSTAAVNRCLTCGLSLLPDVSHTCPGQLIPMLGKIYVEEDDPVNHPPHYKRGGLECIDVIEAAGLGFCRGNATKYIWRCGFKQNSIEDLRKSIWYISHEINYLTTERWKIWPVDNRYEVSSFGNVRRIGALVNRKPVSSKNGYLTIVRYENRKHKCTYVHKMVAETFISYPIPDGFDVCHNNGIKSDCRLHNLRIDTRVGNFKDKHRHGTYFNGSNNHSARLTEQQVAEIRKTNGSGVEVGRKFNVSGSTIGRIRRGESWVDHRLPVDILIEKAESLFSGNIKKALRLLWRGEVEGDLVINLQESRWAIIQEIEHLERKGEG